MKATVDAELGKSEQDDDRITKFELLDENSIFDQILYQPAGVFSPKLSRIRPNDGIYQQDNARRHTARSVCAWFEEHQDEFTVLLWPANSPDLNPIENLWDHLDRVVRAMDPQPRNLAQLATALESAWLNILVNAFRNLIDSLPARLAAVRSAKGGYSGF
ncbi:hypothetical protein AVEN_141853-1 [Araneus ventricosus]|uniref:Tc1-like transposase DDE domain-containing protein n=1 Tax=Araneus ventricosus TaxID=182803 RepID=A0A4Y2L2F3_ARAVE|nr:hypothetical protein AVEN_141853-1 [Araneus ventricosus]